MDFLCCPRCHAALSNPSQCSNSTCPLSLEPFLQVSGQPVLVDFDQSILVRSDFLRRQGDSPVARSRWRWLDFLDRTHERVAADIAADMVRRLAKGARLLVIGGGSIGSGMDTLYANLQVVSLDIYASRDTDFVADGHDLPIRDASFDAVWIQAVLEHVLDPPRVASEIWRILKPGGLVFADTPLMQQVHAGAYDFTRFTVSGHRWLFRRFELISAGASSGAGTALQWSIRYFFSAIFGSGRVGRLAALPFFWLRYLDGFSRLHQDAACGVYFYGIKTDHALDAADMIAFYEAQFRHGGALRSVPRRARVIPDSDQKIVPRSIGREV